MTVHQYPHTVFYDGAPADEDHSESALQRLENIAEYLLENFDVDVEAEEIKKMVSDATEETADEVVRELSMVYGDYSVDIHLGDPIEIPTPAPKTLYGFLIHGGEIPATVVQYATKEQRLDGLTETLARFGQSEHSLTRIQKFAQVLNSKPHAIRNTETDMLIHFFETTLDETSEHDAPVYRVPKGGQ